MFNKSHSRNTSLQSIIKEGELPDEPIGIGADRVYESGGHRGIHGRSDDDFTLRGAFEIPPAYQEKKERKGRSRSRNNQSKSRSVSRNNRSSSRSNSRSNSRPNSRIQSPEPQSNNYHNINTNRTEIETAESHQQMPELFYGKVNNNKKSVSPDRRRSEPMGFAADRVNEGHGKAGKGDVYQFSNDGRRY